MRLVTNLSAQHDTGDGGFPSFLSRNEKNTESIRKLPMTEIEPLIELNNVSVALNGIPVLHEIRWQLRPGELEHRTVAGKRQLAVLVPGVQS